MNYQQAISVNADSQKVFDALSQQINLWWGKTNSITAKSGDEFTIQFSNGYYWTFQVKEFLPNKKLAWECVDGEPEFNREWIGTTIHWSIESNENRTTLKLTHDGLTPALHCYDVCPTTWNMFITDSLKSFLETGVGKPDV